MRSFWARRWVSSSMSAIFAGNPSLRFGSVSGPRSFLICSRLVVQELPRHERLPVACLAQLLLQPVRESCGELRDLLLQQHDVAAGPDHAHRRRALVAQVFERRLALVVGHLGKVRRGLRGLEDDAALDPDGQTVDDDSSACAVDEVLDRHRASCSSNVC